MDTKDKINKMFDILRRTRPEFDWFKLNLFGDGSGRVGGVRWSGNDVTVAKWEGVSFFEWLDRFVERHEDRLLQLQEAELELAALQDKIAGLKKELGR